MKKKKDPGSQELVGKEPMVTIPDVAIGANQYLYMGERGKKIRGIR